MFINIIYDHQIFTRQQYGGISRYYYEVAKRVGKTAGFSATVVAPIYINEFLQYGAINVKGLYLPAGLKTVAERRRLITMVNRILTPLLLGSRRTDVVHETYYSFQSAVRRGCPKVVTIHDMIYEKFPHMFPSNDNTSDAKRAAVARADRVICVSEHTRQDLVAIFGIKPEKTSVIHHGYTLTSNDSFPAPVLNERPFLLFVGGRGGYKNFDILLAAYASSSLLRREFALVAFGGGAFTAHEISKQRELGLDLGTVQQLSGPDELLAARYRQAAALVYPSLYEGFGIPPLEAMSFDCPVVCSNTSSIPEVVGNAARLFDPYDVDDIRKAIESVIMSDLVRHDLIIHGRERIQHFSWDKCATETIEVYKELV
jgi:glycosyltransferase involved in cell wall biosynthesis